ncbi:MAG: DMT family transporter [Rhodobacteraceae bacterium]|jgi:drug/metabolite transporter (DMT)-like permease|nr:DMT family transporter [Paracoccaceae bacterium]
MTPGPRNIPRAIALKLLSVALFVVMQALVKVTADRVPAGEAVFFRSFFALPVILAWIALRGQWPLGLWPRAPLGHLWRGVLGTVSMGLGFAGLAYLPLPEVTAIGYAAPLLAVVFAAVWLGERVPVPNRVAVLVGLCGVLVVLYPRFTVFDGATAGHAELLGAALVLGCAVFAALAQTVVRALLSTDRTPIIVLWFSVTATGLSLLTIPFGWVVPRPSDAVALVASGVVGAVAQILMTESYRHAGAGTVAPLDYASLLFALAIGYAAFGEVPSPSLLAGAPLVILAGVLVALRRGDGRDNG